MPHGKIAGFDRPLAESEIIISFTYDVDYDYGLSLETNSKRKEQEEIFEDKFRGHVDVLGSLDDYTVRLSPAGRSLGVDLATGTTELLSDELNGIERAINNIADDMGVITGFIVPSAYGRNAGKMIDRLEYTIKTK